MLRRRYRHHIQISQNKIFSNTRFTWRNVKLSRNMVLHGACIRDLLSAMPRKSMDQRFMAFIMWPDLVLYSAFIRSCVQNITNWNINNFDNKEWENNFGLLVRENVPARFHNITERKLQKRVKILKPSTQLINCLLTWLITHPFSLDNYQFDLRLINCPLTWFDSRQLSLGLFCYS